MNTRMLVLAAVLVAGCTRVDTPTAKTGRFAGDVAFMKKHTEIIVLSGADGQAQVAVAPALQGRVMTSTAAGPEGLSFGWINFDLFASGKKAEHINVYGGEDRFWMGPEGGQFSIFFKKGVPFDFEHWFTPACIDTEAFETVRATPGAAFFRRKIQIENYSGFPFDLEVNREVRLLDGAAAWKWLGVPAPAGVKVVAFETDNRLVNAGKEAWKKETGLLSIWILGMFNPSPQTTVVVPFNSGPEADLGPIVNDAYFGKVPAERLLVGRNVLFFSADGKYRSKIGLTPKRSKGVCGSYDAANGVLTLVQFNKPDGAAEYVNSMWALQEKPFAGDTVNSYNDGPVAPGAKPLGPFYELETSSPAAALEPGAGITHVHRTIHIQGPEAALDPVARTVLGVGLAEVQAAFGGKK
jgi:hypothetical protein